MRIFLPERIPIKWISIFACAMLLVQVLQGTSFSFALLHLFFLIVWAVGFNVAGGFTRPTGAYIFWLGLLTIPVGTIAKAAIGDPADSNSWTPVLSMTVFTAGMAAAGVAAMCVRRLLGRTSSLAEGISHATPIRYREASMGCSVLALMIAFSPFFLPANVVNVLFRINVFVLLAVLLGTLHVIEASGGRKMLGLLNGAPAVYGFLMGVMGFSKEGMMSPFVAMIIAVAYTRFRVRAIHVVLFAAGSFVMFYALVPVAQLGRGTEAGNAASAFTRLGEAVSLLEDMKGTRELYVSNTEQVHDATLDYFSRDVGMLARFTRWPGDDRLISYTSHGNQLGYGPLGYVFINWAPHAILPNKEQFRPVAVGGGNYYAREIGILKQSDTTTGISFSPFAEMFHLGGWYGLLLVAPLIWFMFFLSVELVAGDIRRTPWGLLPALAFAHLAPEGGLLQVVTYVVYGNIALIFGIVFTTYVAPVLGVLFVPRNAPEPFSFAHPRGVPSQFADRAALNPESIS